MAENPPGTLSIMTKAAGVPVDRYASESVELLKDIDARWTSLREIRDAIAYQNDQEWQKAEIKNVPDVDIFTIEVSFKMLADKAERDYLNELPTSFVLPAEAVDRLRAAAGKILLASPDLHEALKGEDFRIVEPR
jgi:NTE family protein